MAYSLAGYRRFRKTLRDEKNKPLTLLPHQAEVVGDHFRGARRVVEVIGKKNGKTTDLAALALYHLDEVPDAMVLIAASSRDQASLIFQQAAGLVQRSGLEERFKVQKGYRRIRLTDRPGEIRVLAGDVDTADGQIPTLALVDELHRHRSAELMSTLYLGLAARDGRMIVISTAGVSLDSPLGLLRQDAQELPIFERDEERKKTFARSEDGSLVWHEWCLDPSDDVDDMALVKKVNPAPWHTIRSLTEFRQGVTPTEWRRFVCGIWVESAEPWIEPPMWDSLPKGRILEGETVWLGVAIGSQYDPKGLVLFAPQTMTVDAVFLPPEASTERLEREVMALAGRYQVAGLVWGSWAFRRSGELLAEQGINVREWPYSPERLSVASATLRRLVDSGELKHTRNPTLRSQVLAGVVRESDRGWRLSRDPHTTRPADALLALAVTAHLGTERPTSRASIYDDPDYKMEVYAG